MAKSPRCGQLATTGSTRTAVDYSGNKTLDSGHQSTLCPPVRRPGSLAWTQGRFWDVPQALGPGLRICRVEIPADAVVPYELVGRPELERAGRIREATEKDRLLGSHAVLRSVLAGATGKLATHLEIIRDEFGKPRLADGSLRFNMSRSKSVALIGLSTVQEIGVDVEIVDEVADVEGLAHEHLSQREYEAWRSLDPASMTRAFLQSWVRKEACAKAAGIGLALRLDQLDVGWAANGIPARVALEYRQRRWETLVVSLPMPPGLVAAAAVVT